MHRQICFEHKELCNAFQSTVKESAETRSKHRSIISKLNQIFGKNSTVFNFFSDTVANFIKIFHHFEFGLCIYLVCFFCLFAYLFVYLFVCVVIMLLLLLCHLCCLYVLDLIHIPMCWHFVLKILL